MSQSLPRLGLDNLLYKNRRHLVASTTADGYSVGDIADLTPGRGWKPTFTANPPSDEYVYVYPLDEDNRLQVTNWFFQDWTNGASAAPDGWTLVGSGSGVSRVTAFKIGEYAASVTRTGTDCYLEFELPNWSELVGLQVTMGAHVRCAAASRARIGIDDGQSQTFSSYNDGDSDYDWHTVTHEVAYNATTVKLRLQVDTGNTSAQFDGVAAYVGASISETPHAAPVNYLAVHGHDLATSGQTIKAQYTTSATPGPAATWVDHISLSPSSDKTAWKDAASQSASAWRVATTGSTGSRPAVLEVVGLGVYTEWPEYIGDGFNPYDRILSTETTRLKSGTPIQRNRRNEPIPLNIELPAGIAETDITGAYSTFADHAIGLALAFFFQWDDGDHESQTFFCWLDDASRMSAGLSRAYQARSLSFSRWMAVQE